MATRDRFTPEADSEADLQIPDGLDAWLRDFVDAERRETEILVLNGATQAVMARRRVISSLLGAARTWLEEEVDVAETARLARCCEETVRRKVRQGELEAERTGQRGRLRIRRGAARALAATPARVYDASADARDIAKLTRRLG
jgi:hypothetical protein